MDKDKEPKVHRQFSPYSGLYNPVNTQPTGQNQPHPIQTVHHQQITNQQAINPIHNIPTPNQNPSQTQSPNNQSLQVAPFTSTNDILKSTHNLPEDMKFQSQGRLLNPSDTEKLTTKENKEIFMKEETKLLLKFNSLVGRNYVEILEEPYLTRYKRAKFYSTATDFIILFSWMGMYFRTNSETGMTRKMKILSIAFLSLYISTNQIYSYFKYNISYLYFNKLYNGLKHSEIDDKLKELRGDIVFYR